MQAAVVESRKEKALKMEDKILIPQTPQRGARPKILDTNTGRMSGVSPTAPSEVGCIPPNQSRFIYTSISPTGQVASWSRLHTEPATIPADSPLRSVEDEVYKPPPTMLSSLRHSPEESAATKKTTEMEDETAGAKALSDTRDETLGCTSPSTEERGATADATNMEDEIWRCTTTPSTAPSGVTVPTAPSGDAAATDLNHFR